MSGMDEIRSFGTTWAEAAAAWQSNVRQIAEDREAQALAIEAECGGREIMLTACMKLIAEFGYTLAGGRRG